MAEHTFQQITPRVWWLNPISASDRPTLGVISGTHGSLIVDAGNSPAHVQTLLAAMQRHDLPAPRFAALTHWHWDHVFGAATLNVPTFASNETQRVMRVMAALDWSDAALDQRVADGSEIAFCRDMIKVELPDRADLVIRPPEIAFPSEVHLDLGGITCRLVHVGGDHSPDAIAIHVPEEQVVFFGDAIYDDLYHGPRRLTSGQLFPLLDRLLAMDAAYYIGGHDPQPIARTQFAADAALLRTIGEAVNRIGDDHDAVMRSLPTLLDEPLNDDHSMIAAAFLAGLRLPNVRSPL